MADWCFRCKKFVTKNLLFSRSVQHECSICHYRYVNQEYVDGNDLCVPCWINCYSYSSLMLYNHYLIKHQIADFVLVTETEALMSPYVVEYIEPYKLYKDSFNWCGMQLEIVGVINSSGKLSVTVGQPQ